VAQGASKDIEDLWEPWMREVDQLLEDATLVERGVRSTREASSQEPDPRASADTGRSRPAATDPETRAELELRHAGARSTRESDISCVHTHRRRKSAGCQDAGVTGTSHRAGGDWEAPCTIDGLGARARRGARAEDAGGHHRRRDKYSLSDRS